ncbi:MAG: hypothetical protein AABY07_05490, partial [Nanoarchaeota archaeon]
ETIKEEGILNETSEEKTPTIARITGVAISEVNLEKKSIIQKILDFFKNFFLKTTGTITGKAIITNETTEVTEVIIDDTALEYEIEYETPAPYAIEEFTERGKRVKIIGSEEIHYENVLSFTELNESLNVKNPQKVRIYWLENDTYLQPSSIQDKNTNGIYDYIEWIAPILSNQTFEIIVITKAEYLDKNKEFISDIYEEVKILDNIWSPTINDEEYVRVTFERNLTSDKDITLYLRITNGNPIIKVYEFNKTELIAEFTNINSNEYNKVFLVNLQNSNDVFDLKILGGNIEIDHIIDPSTTLTLVPTTSGTQIVVGGALTENTFTFANATEISSGCYDQINTSGNAQCRAAGGSNSQDSYFWWNITLPAYENISSVFLTSISGQAGVNGSDTMSIAAYNFSSSAWAYLNVTRNPGALGINRTMTYNISAGLDNNFVQNNIIRFISRTNGT